MLHQKMPYGLFRTSYSHNPQNIRNPLIFLRKMATYSCFGGDKGQKSSCKQACVRLLTFIPGIIHIVSRACALAGYHAGSYRVLRCTYLAKHLAVGRFAFSLQYISATACRICFSFDLWHIVFLSGIVCFPFFSQLHTGSRNDSKTSPLAVASFHQFIHQPLCLTASFSGDNSRIAVYEERLSSWKRTSATASAVSSSFAVNPATTPLTPSFTSSSQSSVPVIALTCPGYKIHPHCL